jgi:hypothetical protein
MALSMPPAIATSSEFKSSRHGGPVPKAGRRVSPNRNHPPGFQVQIERSGNMEIFKSFIINFLRFEIKNWHATRINIGINLNESRPMTLIIFISACLLTFGLIEVKESFID